MTVKILFCAVLVAAGHFQSANSHGMMLNPPNRASLWRFDWTRPSNYNDNELFCGGVQNQYEKNGGKCGVCGDNYADPQPRSNENTGYFSTGKVMKIYEAGSVIDTEATLTANHLGTFTFSLCVLEDPSRPEPEDCFEDLVLEDGSALYNVTKTDYIVKNRVRLPEGVTCERCVLRWHYTCGNSWGICADGSTQVGCGDQETFRSCADIAVV